MIAPHPLDRLVEQDTFAEAMALLEPEELVIASLRLEALSDEQIAALLDVDRATICRRMEQARRRIVEALPELAPVLRDRNYRSQRCRRQLQRGWLCPSGAGAPFVRADVRGPSQPAFDAGPQHQETRELARRIPYLLRARSGR